MRQLARRLLEAQKRHERLRSEAEAKAREVQAFEDELAGLKAELVEVREDARDAERALSDAKRERERRLRSVPKHVLAAQQAASRAHSSALRRLDAAKTQAEDYAQRAAWLKSKGRKVPEDERKRADALTKSLPNQAARLKELAAQLAEAQADLDEAYDALEDE